MNQQTETTHNNAFVRAACSKSKWQALCLVAVRIKRQIVLSILLVAANAFATTYYIDYASGSDSNSGTSKTSAWQRCPGMNGFAGTYSHTAGDRFVFKGGVTWPNGCFPLAPFGGSSSTVLDYYGVDATWYSGSAWARPIWNAGGIKIANGNRFVVTKDYMTLDSFELVGFYSDGIALNPQIELNGQYATVTNCYFHGWTHAPYTSGVNEDVMVCVGNLGCGSVSSSPVVGCTMIGDCVITSTGYGTAGSGFSTRGIAVTRNCHISNMPEGPLPFSADGYVEVSGCDIGNIGWSFQGGSLHPNGIEPIGKGGSCPALESHIFNNYIHECWAVTTFFGGISQPVVYFYNNVVVDPVNRDSGGAGYGLMLDARPFYSTVVTANKAFIYNNTFIGSYNGGTTGGIRVVGDGTSSSRWDVLNVRNNQFIGCSTVDIDAGVQVISQAIDHNLQQTYSQASTNGYNDYNLWAPINGSAPTVDMGTPITGLFSTDYLGTPRPSGAAWDIGAYEYFSNTNPAVYVLPAAWTALSVQTNTTVTNVFTVKNVGGGILSGTAALGGATTGFKILSGGTYSLAAGQSQSVVVTYTPTGSGTNSDTLTFKGGNGSTVPLTGTPLTVLPGLSFESYAGTISAPFVTNGGYVVQSIATGETNGGRAVYGFYVSSAGNYTVSANVNAPDTSANSFYVNIDGEPSDPTMIWDVPVTTGFSNQVVSWRGNGTPDANQFVPNVFNLSAGIHQLVIVGREANAQLGRITIAPYGTATALPPQPPTVSTIAQSSADVDPNVAGLQVFAGSTVQYSAVASDPQGLPLSWQWIYTVNGGPENVLASGTGPVTSASFTYDATTAGNTYVWKLRVSNGSATAESDLTVGVEPPPVALGGLTLQAPSGSISAPFVAANGSISQTMETGVTNGGQAVYSFTITNAGNYTIQALVNAPSSAANSFYINVDAQPQDPAMIWDIALTTGFEQRVVSWRGNGTSDADQYAPKVFNLLPGVHQLILVGREANTQLQQFSILPVPTAPKNLRIVAHL